MYRPTRNAIGIDAAIVKVPQGLPLSAFTTNSARTPSRISRMKSTASDASRPAKGPTSVLIMRARLIPSRRVEKARITMSWTPPISTAPRTIQRKPGRNPNCAASVGPISGPGPAIQAKCIPNSVQRRNGM